MTGFEAWTSGVRSDHSTNWATARLHLCFYRFKLDVPILLFFYIFSLNYVYNVSNPQIQFGRISRFHLSTDFYFLFYAQTHRWPSHFSTYPEASNSVSPTPSPSLTFYLAHIRIPLSKQNRKKSFLCSPFSGQKWWTVWPDKNRQMSIKVAQIWFH